MGIPEGSPQLLLWVLLKLHRLSHKLHGRAAHPFIRARTLPGPWQAAGIGQWENSPSLASLFPSSVFQGFAKSSHQ